MNAYKRFMASLMVFVMLAVTLPANSEKAGASTVNDMQAVIAEIILEAGNYLTAEMDEDGGLGNALLINDTAEAAAVMRNFTDNDSSKALEWIASNDYDANIDTLARTVMATNDAGLLEEIMACQNGDGGFGLSEGYQSDILDSVLVLEAINAAGSDVDKGEAFRLVSYIARQANADGSFSYTKASDGNIILSAMALYTVSKYMTDNNIRSDLTTNMMNKTYGMLIQEFDATFSKDTIEENVYIALALEEYQGLENPEVIVDTLKGLQAEDGSFYDDVHITTLVVWLLSKMDISHMVKVYDMQTANTDTAYYGADTEINVNYAIAYSASIDASCQIKCTVMNGDRVIYDGDRQEVTLCKDENILQGSLESFYVNQNCDDGIVVITTLYCGDTVMKECTGSITMENQPRAGETELTDFSLSLNHYYTYTDTPVEVNAEYKLLYTTNIHNEVDMQVILSKDGDIISEETYEEELAPEQDSVKRAGLTFTPDVSEAGTYEIKVRCLYQGDCIAERTAEFIVADVPGSDTGESDIATGSDAEEVTEPFTVSWIGPMLSDYCLYAGKETEVNVSFGILYYSEENFTGKAVTEVTDGDTVIEKQETSVALTSDSRYFEADNILSLSIKELGEYNVTVTLYDAEGEKINSGSRTIEVLERKKLDLIADSSISDTEDRTVDISWNDISNSQESYNYRLYRRYEGTDWESRSIWNESEKIKVLNVYPAGPYLAEWMTTTISGTGEPAGMGLFDITSVHISAFNRIPDQYLYDENGNFIYDVIFFGSADVNGRYDLSAQAVPYVQAFIDSGRGVLFGHDTVCSHSFGHTQFNKFAGQLGLRIYNCSVYYRATTVSVNTIGTLTNFPWTVRGTLTIPATHSSGQYVNNDSDTIEWMTINAYQRNDGEGYHDNFYLVTKNNLGMIQTGDSTGQASDDERKVLANTLFYLHQISQETTAKDNSFYDLAAPDVPEVKFVSTEDRTAVIKISAEDKGTKYQYYIEAMPGTDDENAVETSNIMTETAVSGIKGYLYEVTDSEDADTALLTYDENNEVVQNVIPADEDGSLTGTIEIPDFNGTYFLHVYAVDYENNVSDELVIPLAEGTLITDIYTDKEAYVTGETVVIDAETSALPYSGEGDVTLSLYDVQGNYIQEIYYSNNQVISVNEPYQLKQSFLLPDDYTGEYSVKIEWTSKGEVLAYDSASFTVADKETDDEGNQDDDSKSPDETETGGNSGMTDEEEKTADSGAEGEITEAGSDQNQGNQSQGSKQENSAQDGADTENPGGQSTDTGDGFALKTAVIIMLAALAGIMFTEKRRKRNYHS